MVTELKQDNLAEVVANNDKVFVQFSASWCGNCRIMKPKFKKLSNEREDATFVIVDAEKYPGSRRLADVSNLPTFASFEMGAFKDQVQTNKFELLKKLVDALPLIKHLTDFVEKNDQDFVLEAIETLEDLTECENLQDEELDVIGELLSNMYASLEVNTMIKEGKPRKEALNDFMQRVMGSVDR